MAYVSKEARSYLRQYRREAGLEKLVDCTDKENMKYLDMINSGQPLPDGIIRQVTENDKSTDYFYKQFKSSLSDAEQLEYLSHIQIRLLKTIKNCLVFFVVLTILGILWMVVTTLKLL